MEDNGFITIHITDVLGHTTKTISHNEVFEAGTHRHTINIANLKSGIYFVSICFNGQQYVEKITITR